MRDDDDVVITRRSRADLDARLRNAVAMHATRHGMPPDRVVDMIERFLERPSDDPDTRLEEMRHRMKNEMQLLSSAMRFRRGMTKAGDRGTCDACIGQATALAQLNAAVDDTFHADEVDLGRRARDFATALCRAFGLQMGAGRLDILTEQIFVPQRVARNVLLIMNEAVTNAVKHGTYADGGAIRVRLTSLSRTTAELTVENDSDPALLQRGGGRGRSLIDALAVGTEGHVERTMTGRTFRLTCRFPVSQSCCP
jgi:two-component sensor histidine kinase